MLRISVFLIFIIALGLKAQEKVQAFSSNLPIVVINTNGQSIPNSVKITAEMGIIYNGDGQINQTSDPFNNYNGRIGIEIRGSSSQMFPKKQYAVETRDSINNNLDVSLLGFPEDNDWILNAPYSDKSLLRNVIVYSIANRMGRYASRSRFCELFLNNEYMGVYILFEKIKRGKGRVDIAKLTAADSTGVDLTGGYIIKIDKWDGENNAGWKSSYRPYAGAWQETHYQYHYPEPDDITAQQRLYIIGFIKNFEAVMNSDNYKDTTTGYPSIIDVDSFVDCFLINELSRNVDGYRLSSFMYKDKDSKDPRLHMGPVWDYNITLGNADYYDGWHTYGWMLDYLTQDSYFLSNDGAVPPFWWKKLWWDNAFRNKVKDRWIELRKSFLRFENIYGFIDSLTNHLKDARIRNFNKWKILSSWVWPNAYIGGTYENEIKYLKDWMRDRFLWMDKALTGAPVDVGDTPELTFELSQNFPNPFNPETTISYSVTETSSVKIDVFDVIGRHVSTLVDEVKTRGRYTVNFNAAGLAGGIYIYRLDNGSNSITRKALYLK